MENLAIIFPRKYPRAFHWICNGKVRNNFQPGIHHTHNEHGGWNSGMEYDKYDYNRNQYIHIFVIEIIILYRLYNEPAKAYFRNSTPRFLRD